MDTAIRLDGMQTMVSKPPPISGIAPTIAVDDSGINIFGNGYGIDAASGRVTVLPPC